jgi:FkbM family methyltransferase
MYNISTSCQIPPLGNIYKKYFGETLGTFVEIGAYDGESFSNTSCLADSRWSGVYVEPVYDFYIKCKERHKNNNIQVLNFAVGQEEKEIDLFVGEAITTTLAAQVARYSEIDWSRHVVFSNSKCKQITLESILRQSNIPIGFELLVIDVEGAEDAVVRSFDIDVWRPKMMIVELEDGHPSFANYKDHVDNHRCTRQYILNAGYSEVYRDTINTVFIHNTIC